MELRKPRNASENETVGAYNYLVQSDWKKKASYTPRDRGESVYWD